MSISSLLQYHVCILKEKVAFKSLSSPGKRILEDTPQSISKKILINSVKNFEVTEIVKIKVCLFFFFHS